MAHVRPLAPEDVPALAGVLEGARAGMGFVPNSMLTMAHLPQLPAAFSLLAGVVFGADLRASLPADAAAGIPDPGDSADNLPPGLLQLVAFACSVGAGCRYCQAHTSHNAHRSGEAQRKLEDVLEFATSDAYSEAERAALDLALAAAAVPNETTEGHFARLREHFSERQIVQLVGVIALFGFLNRWNDTLATELEGPPLQFAAASLEPLGWQAGKHGPHRA